MKRYIYLVLLLCILVSAISCGKKAVNPVKTEEGVPVTVVKPERRDIVVYYETSATVKANDVRTVSFAVPGEVAVLSKENGERIKKWEVLAQLDRTNYQKALEAAESSLIASHNGLEAAKQQKMAAENQLKDAENRLAQIEKDYQRFKKLHTDKVITDKEFEEIELGYKSAQLGVESARSALRMAESQVASASEAVKASTAQRDMAKKQYDDAVILAPFDGTISKKYIEVGAIVGGGMPIYDLVADGGMKIETTLPERFLKDVKSGDTVLVSVPAIECELSPQNVSLVHHDVNKNTGNFGVTIELKDVNGCLRHGMFAHLKFEIARHNNVVSVPVLAVIEMDDSKYVYVVENGKAVKRLINTGLASKDYVEITSGLDGNEDVILSGNRYVVDNSVVRVITEKNLNVSK